MAKRLNHEELNSKNQALRGPTKDEDIRRIRLWWKLDKLTNAWLKEHGEPTHEGLNPGPGIATPMR